MSKSVRSLPPDAAGIGLKTEYEGDVLREAGRPGLSFVEIHAENFMIEGGPRLACIAAIGRHVGLSVHGVSASLGGAEPLDRNHLARLKILVGRLRPALVSEHLAWCRRGGRYHADLLPVPYDRASLELVTDHVKEVQDLLGRAILIENPSTYFEFAISEMMEAEFLAELVERTGCGLLFDINNLHVSALNHGWEIDRYLNALPGDAIGEYHLAGHTIEHHREGEFRIDTHDAPVAADVWALFETVVARFGAHPTLIERDDHLPPFAELLAEAARAAAVLQASTGRQNDKAAGPGPDGGKPERKNDAA
ncbi:MAG: DUF692 domain-containing protein [Alphaproteobacteria bacterium]|nr:MAG: DUF692 domain-containing protein [Alphaproteobacteria bacterium]